MRTPLFLRALAYNLDAHRANAANLAAGAAGMVINNVIFLAGVWAMFFAGKARNQELVPYFVALQVVVMTSWGAVAFFLGGLRSLPEYVTDGSLEPMLATPRSPVLLAAISRSGAPALGDLLMGLAGVGAIAWKWGGLMALASLVAAAVSAVGFAALFILAGAICFFIPRGNPVGNLLIEVTLSLSVYPSGKIFSTGGRLALLLTPVAVTSLLPLDIVEKLGIRELALACLVALASLAVSLGLFRWGLRKYRATSLIGARR